MPTVDLHSRTDYASIYYTTNTPHSNVSGFDPEKPTIVMLHPAFLDSSWLDMQMADSRLDAYYNIIAFDMRSSGKSSCRLTGRHDSWVDAADLAFCFQKLQLPSSHILALEGSSICCALRFAVLFSEMCLSLTLVNVPSPLELKWIYKNIDQLIHASSFAEELESFEQASFALIEFLFGPRTDLDLIDELVVYWGMSHPPSERARMAETASVYINRSPLSPEAYATIAQPVLIIQGEKNELCPMKYAEKLKSQLSGVKDDVILFPVKGGTSMISVVPGNASIVNKVFANFLARQPHHRSDVFTRRETSILERMSIALRKLSELTGNREATSLDPMCSMSFSSLSPETVRSQAELLRHYQKDASIAFTPSPTTEGDRTRTRYSQNHRAGWTYSDKAGISFTGSGTTIVIAPPGKQDTERSSKSSSRSEGSVDSPLLRSIFSVDKPNLKTVANAPSTPLQRLMS